MGLAYSRAQLGPCTAPQRRCLTWTLAIAEEKLTFSEIRERANLPEEDLVRILHSLSCSKYKILAKDPPGKAPGKNDTFSINMAFTDRMRRIKVPHCIILTPDHLPTHLLIKGVSRRSASGALRSHCRAWRAPHASKGILSSANTRG